MKAVGGVAGQVFYDLGSGLGKAVFQVHWSRPVLVCQKLYVKSLLGCEGVLRALVHTVQVSTAAFAGIFTTRPRMQQER